MSDSEDKTLIKRCLIGDSRAFERLIQKYQKPIFNAAIRIVGDYEDARDITQAVFVKAYEKLDAYDSRYKFFSWIYRMTVNEAINLTARRKEQTRIDPDSVSDTDTPEVIFERNVLSGEVDEAVGELPLEYRLVIIFRHWVDLPYRDIGYILDIPENTVKSRLYSARRLLAEIMIKRGLVTNG